MQNSYRLRVRNYAFLYAKTVNTRGFSTKTNVVVTLLTNRIICRLKTSILFHLKSCYSKLYNEAIFDSGNAEKLMNIVIDKTH